MAHSANEESKRRTALEAWQPAAPDRTRNAGPEPGSTSVVWVLL